jgi:glutamine---fructose-6-phosphate transaminase (isomerizing)
MDAEKAIMLTEIGMQPDFVRANIDDMLRNMRDVLKSRAAGTLRNGFMIGCGDSYCAGMAARSYMTKTTGLWVEAVEALEFSRYLVEDLPGESFVFGVSNSGTVSRTIEGVRLARERGAWTFAVTVSQDTNLARTAETLLKVQAPPNIKQAADGSKLVTPGTLTYTASMLGLYAAAIAIGEHLGRIDAAHVAGLIDELHRTADHMAAADAANAELCRVAAHRLTAARKVVILGGGPSYATAYFGLAKFFEALQHPAQFAEMEEWAHEQYFITDENTETIIVLPPGGSRERGLEQARAAREMGSHVHIIGPQDDEAAQAAADTYYPMPPGIREALSPFVYKLPFEYLTCHAADQRGAAFLGFDNKKRQEVNFRQIFNSAQSKSAA